MSLYDSEFRDRHLKWLFTHVSLIWTWGLCDREGERARAGEVRETVYAKSPMQGLTYKNAPFIAAYYGLCDLGVTCHCGPKPSVFFPCLAGLPSPLDGAGGGKGGPGHRADRSIQPRRRG